MVVLRFCCFRAHRACPQSQGVSNWNVGFLLVPACFSVVMSLGHDTCSLQDAFGFVWFRWVVVFNNVVCSVMLCVVRSLWFVTAPRGCWLCSMSLPGGNQVDGLPPVPSDTCSVSVHHI